MITAKICVSNNLMDGKKTPAKRLSLTFPMSQELKDMGASKEITVKVNINDSRLWVLPVKKEKAGEHSTFTLRLNKQGCLSGSFDEHRVAGLASVTENFTTAYNPVVGVVATDGSITFQLPPPGDRRPPTERRRRSVQAVTQEIEHTLEVPAQMPDAPLGPDLRRASIMLRKGTECHEFPISEREFYRLVGEYMS